LLGGHPIFRQFRKRHPSVRLGRRIIGGALWPVRPHRSTAFPRAKPSPLGTTRDPAFAAMMMVGARGIMMELCRDVVYRLAADRA
jgi:acyl-CoA synthetase (NDP forming)